MLQAAFSQHKVTGTVTDAQTGEPLPGVNIVIEGTNKGTTTDFDGKYSIIASPDDMLVFSYVGYQTVKEKVGNRKVINVALQPGETLREVVVDITGEKKDVKVLSYSVQKVKEQELKLSDIVNVKASLQGKVAGAQVWEQAGSKLGYSPKVRLRGRISLSSDPDALYVVDGVPVRDISFLDADDIASVEVLKGPNATAIYGQRGENGVIVITTKTAQRGVFRVDVDSKISVEKIAYLPKYQDWYGQGAAGDNDWGTFSNGPVYPEWDVFNGKRFNLRTYYDESWGPKFDGKDYVPWYAWWPDSPYFGQTAKWVAQPDNVKNFFNTGIFLKNHVMLQSSQGDYSARVSFSSLDQKGVLPYSQYKRYFLNGNFQYNVGKNLRLGVTTMFSKFNREGDFDDSYGNQTSGSFNAWFARDLEMDKQRELIDLKTPEGYLASWNMWRATWIAHYANYPGYEYLKKPVFWFNHYTWLDRYKRYNFGNQLAYSVWGKYEFNKAWSAKVMYSSYRNNSQNEYYLPYEIEYSSAHDAYLPWINSFGKAMSTFTENDIRGFLFYKTDLSEKVSLDAMVGSELRMEDSYGVVSWMNPEDIENGLLVPDVYQFANTKIPINARRSESHKRVVSAFGKLTFGYEDLLYLEVTGRQDWSSALPENNNGYFYPSVGLSFNFHKLDAFEKYDWLNYGKFRIGWAQVGSDVGAHLIYPRYRFVGENTYYGSAGAIATPSYIVDPNLKPALNSSFETGVDLKFLDNRAGLSLTYYYEKRQDEIIFQSITPATGYYSYLTNGGTSHRSGIELSLEGTPIRKNDFDWTMKFNFSRNRTIVDVVPGPQEEMFAPGVADTWGRVFIVHREGEEWGQMKGYDIKRDENGNPYINPSNGLYVRTEQQVYFGSVLPRFVGGFTNILTYKDFTFAAHFTFQKGGKFYSGSEVWGYYSGLYEETGMGGEREKGYDVSGVYEDASGQVHDIDMNISARKYFKQFHQNNIAGPFVHDASYLKLRELSLRYRLPKKVLGKFLKGAEVGVIGTNVWLIAVSKDNYHRWDPSELSQVYGEDAQLPGTRRFGMNIKLSF